MTVREARNQRWARKHDDPGQPTRQSVDRVVYPDSLIDLIDLCTSPGKAGLRAAGSHWALSETAVSDGSFVETHDPNDRFSAMGRTLYDVIPTCMTEDYLDGLATVDAEPYDGEIHEQRAEYLVHFESGKRIYQLYAELDQGDENNPRSLASLLAADYNQSSYRGPWALPTMGGGAGQTFVGAALTGTHGGDFMMGPIADSIRAIHLVADGGRHYWIEPDQDPPITDDDKLYDLYGRDEYGGIDNFEIKRDTELFDAVRIGGGRFGIIYSIVIGVVRQFSLQERRELTTWQDVRDEIAKQSSWLYTTNPPLAFPNRFLQIVVSLTPTVGFSSNLAGVTRRWQAPRALNPATGEPSGRAERVGPIIDAWNDDVAGPLFGNAGNSHAYTEDPDRVGQPQSPSILEQACANPNFLLGVIDALMDEIQDFIDSNGVEIGVGLAIVAAAGGGLLLGSLIPALAIILALLRELVRRWAASSPRLGNVLDDIRGTILGGDTPAERAAGILVWQALTARLFASQQGPHDYTAISYAVMDLHDYLDQSCNVNVDSLEVFFDADSTMLLAFVDSLIEFEINQEMRGKATIGYASLRFTNATTAPLGEQKWERTCVIEVAALRDVDGGEQLIDYASELALNPNYGARVAADRPLGSILHWGQRNDSTQTHIQHRFGDNLNEPGRDLGRWRASLSEITDNGRLNRFSNTFTKRTGLEVVQPIVGPVSVNNIRLAPDEPTTIRWDAADNPPDTRLKMLIVTPSGARQLRRLATPAGMTVFAGTELGTYRITITATLRANNETRTDDETISIVVA